MFQQSAANLNFFPYRLHNEMLDKKINSTHDCQDYYNSFAVEISRNFTTSAYTEHTQRGSTWCKTAQNVPGHRPPLSVL